MTRKRLLQLHRWSGVVFGVLLLVLSVTGTSLVFRDEIEGLIHPSLTVIKGPKTVPIQAVIAKSYEQYPTAAIRRVVMPDDPETAIIVHMKDNMSGDTILLAVDPYTANAIRGGGLSAWPMELLFHTHDSLLAGSMGEFIVAIEGIALLFMAITGLFIWWPGKKRLKNGFKVFKNAGIERFVRSLHRSAGACVAAILIISAVTGSLMLFKADLYPVVGAVAKIVPRPKPSIAAQPEQTMMDVDTFIAKSLQNYGSSRVREIRLFGQYGQVAAVYLQDESVHRKNAAKQIYYNRYTGDEVDHYMPKDLPAATTFFDWLFTVHTGEAAGFLGRMLIFVGGLGLVFFAGSGLWLWSLGIVQKRSRKLRSSSSRT